MATTAGLTKATLQAQFEKLANLYLLKPNATDYFRGRTYGLKRLTGSLKPPRRLQLPFHRQPAGQGFVTLSSFPASRLQQRRDLVADRSCWTALRSMLRCTRDPLWLNGCPDSRCRSDPVKRAFLLNKPEFSKVAARRCLLSQMLTKSNLEIKVLLKWQVDVCTHFGKSRLSFRRLPT